jgi:hypothetical protein
MSLELRFAGPEDAGEIVALVRELAEYERLLDQMSADEAQLRKTLFGPRTAAVATARR